MANNKKEIDTNGRVSITNLRDYELHFAAIEGHSDIKIPAHAKNYRRLTFNEVDSQVKSDNKFFTGTDGKGANANIIIDDADVRNYIFGVTAEDVKDINTYVLSEETVSALLKIKDIKKFKAELSKYVVDEGDKRTLMVLATKVGIDKATVAQKTAIEKITEYSFSDAAVSGDLED